MKKVLLVCSAVLVLAVFVPAAVTFDLGVKAGASISNQRWSDDEGTEKALVKPTFGAYLTFNIAGNIAIQPEIWYLPTGEYWTGTVGSDNWKEVWVANYLHIPVLLKVRLATKGKLIPYAFAGPALGILLSAKNKHYLNGQFDSEVDVKAWHKSTDFGADLGLGAEMMMSTLKLSLELRYYLGLLNAASADTIDTMKNNSLIIAIGVGFNASKR
jgi:hypothetical protein